MTDSRRDERLYCSQQDTDISMLGSAEQVDVWLLIEAPGSWPAQAVAEGPLSEPLQRWLREALTTLGAAGFRVRPQLIKQPRSEQTTRRLFIGYAGALYLFDAHEDQALLGLDIAALIERVRTGATNSLQRVAEPQYFVCTNGRRDLCCARYGLPVFRQLQTLVGNRAWRTSHVGGHRFAPNVFTLPDGVLYGRVQPETTPEFVRAVEAGAVYFDCLRGRSVYPPAVQAAEGLLALPGLKLLHVQEAGNGTSVEFAGSQQRHSLVVNRASEPHMVLAGCDKTERKAYFPFVVDE